MCRRLLCLELLALLLLTPATLGATYYLSPEGSDDGPGTRQRPWKTLDKANRTLQPGDAVILDHYGDVLSRLGREEEAREAWKMASEIDPDAEGPRSKLRGD